MATPLNNYGSLATDNAHLVQQSGGIYNESATIGTININQVPIQLEWTRPRETDRSVHVDKAIARSVPMQWLEEHLLSRSSKVVAITGINGVGKTTLATMFANKFENNFGGILWESLAKEVTQAGAVQPVLNRFAAWAFGGTLVGIQAHFGNQPFAFSPENVRMLLENHGTILLIVDEARFDEPLQTLLTALPSQSRMLILTEHNDLAENFAQPNDILHLGDMQPEEALAMLRSQLQSATQDELKTLLQVIGSHPQLLQIAISQLTNAQKVDRTYSIRDYIADAGARPYDEPEKALRISYLEIVQDQPEKERWMRRLGVLTLGANDFSTSSAAYVLDAGIEETEKFLRALRDRSLVSIVESDSEVRWSTPSILRRHIGRLLNESGEWEEVEACYTDYYHRWISRYIQADEEKDARRLVREIGHLLYLVDKKLTSLENASSIDDSKEAAFALLQELALQLLSDSTTNIHVIPWMDRAAKVALALHFLKYATRFYMILAIAYRDRRMYEPAKKAFAEALRLAQEGQFDDEATWTYIYMSSVHYSDVQIELANKDLREGLRIAEKINDLSAQMTSLSLLGRIGLATTSYESAQKYFEQALQIAQQMHWSGDEAALHSDLADVYVQSFQRDKAFESFDKGLRLARDNQNDLTVVSILHRKARANAELQQWNDSLRDIREARRIYQQALARDELNEGPLILDEAIALFGLEKHDEAIDLLGEVRSIADKMRSRLLDAQAEQIEARFALEMGNPEKAVMLVTRVLPILDETGDIAGKASALVQLILAYNAQGKQREALDQVFQSWNTLVKASNRLYIVRILSLSGELIRSTKNYEQGIKFMEEAISIADKAQYLAANLVARNWLAILYKEQGRVEDSLEILENLPVLNKEQVENSAELSLCYSVYGLSKLLLGKSEEARSFFNTSLELVERQKDWTSMASVLEWLADLSIRLDQYDDAQGYIERGLQIATRLNNLPLQIMLNLRLSMVYELKEKLVEAQNAIEDALNLQEEPTDLKAQSMARRAYLLFRREEYEEALKAYAEEEEIAHILKSNLYLASAKFGAGIVRFVGKKEHQEALKTMEEAVALFEKMDIPDDPNHESPQALRALVDFFRATISAEALRLVMVQFIRLTSWDAARTMLLNDNNLLLSDKGERYLSTIVRRNNRPEHQLMYRILIVYERLLKECRISGSVEEGLRRVRESKDNHVVYYWWGAQHRAAREYGPALENLNRAIEMKDDIPGYLIERGWIYRGLGTYKLALADFQRVITREKLREDEKGLAYLGTGAVKYDSRDYQGAVGDFTRAIRLLPEDAYAYQWRGAAYQAMGNLHDGLGDYEKAVRLDSVELSHRYWRALAWLENNDTSDALKELTMLIEREREVTGNLVNDLIWAGVAHQLMLDQGKMTARWEEARRNIEEISLPAEKNVRLGFLAAVQQDVTRARQYYEAAVRAKLPRHARHTQLRHLILLSNLFKTTKAYELEPLIRWIETQF